MNKLTNENITGADLAMTTEPVRIPTGSPAEPHSLSRLRAERDRFVASWERHQNGPANTLGLAVVYLLAELRGVLDEPA